jgi:hypothetical protein
MEPALRINAFDTGDLVLRALEAIVTSPVLPQATCTPYVESGADDFC